jgi:hypothetical protein
MTTRRELAMLAAAASALRGAFGPASAQAQPLTGAPTPPVFRYTTPMPSGVVMPATVETGFGRLNFFDGVPDAESTRLIYDNLDRQRALQAYLLGLPAVNQAANRNAILSVGPINTTVPIWERLVDSRTVELTANNNTPYTWFWVDLRNGPLVVEVPPGVLGLINDMFYSWVADVGITGADRGRGGKYLLVPPGHRGAVPQQGYTIVRPKTFQNWFAWRSFPVNGDFRPAVDSVKRRTKIYPLSRAANPPRLTFVDMSERPFNMVGPSDFRFWEMLNDVVQVEPSSASDPITLGFFASIGIQKGKPFQPDDRMRRILTEAAVAGDATARALSYRARDPEARIFSDRRWRFAFQGGYQFAWQPGVTNLDARAFFFFLATGVTPAMDTQVVGEGSTYPWTAEDSQGNALDGGKTYRLHLPGPVPVRTFWSTIVYDTQTRSMLQTDNRFPSVSSQNPGLQVNADRSVDVWFGPTAPAGKESNWVQTIPGKSWFMILRLYGPLQPWFDKSWKPGDIELQG